MTKRIVYALSACVAPLFSIGFGGCGLETVSKFAFLEGVWTELTDRTNPERWVFERGATLLRERTLELSSMDRSQPYPSNCYLREQGKVRDVKQDASEQVAFGVSSGMERVTQVYYSVKSASVVPWEGNSPHCADLVARLMKRMKDGDHEERWNLGEGAPGRLKDVDSGREYSRHDPDETGSESVDRR